MEIFNFILSFLYQLGDAFAFLVLSSVGLAIIFGMMGVINLAHGEFIMCGAYVTAATVRAGVPLPGAILLGALAAGLAGILVERLVIRYLYQRPLDTIVATWGISLIVTQGILILIGPSFPGIGTPLGGFTIGEYSYSSYRVVLMTISIIVLAILYLLFNYTRFGIVARATIQGPQMAAALGINTSLIYSLTFGLGAALAGMTGGLFVPTMTLAPGMGATFIVEAFVTVVVGGTDVFLGTAPAAAVLATIKSGLTAWQGQLIGQIGLLIAVMIVIRILPQGVSGWIIKRGVKL